MKARLALTLALCCAVAVTPAIAGSQAGWVKDVYFRNSDGLILVDLVGAYYAYHPAACVHQRYWIIPNETTDSGKRLYSTLLAALAFGYRVVILGKDTCS